MTRCCNSGSLRLALGASHRFADTVPLKLARISTGISLLWDVNIYVDIKSTYTASVVCLISHDKPIYNICSLARCQAAAAAWCSGVNFRWGVKHINILFGAY